MDESGWKRKIVKEINEAGGYALRIEDKHAVGRLDTLIVVPREPTVFMVEFKIVRGGAFGPTPRQYEEGKQIERRGYPLLPVLAGVIDDDRIMVAYWCKIVRWASESEWAGIAKNTAEFMDLLRTVGKSYAR